MLQQSFKSIDEGCAAFGLREPDLHAADAYFKNAQNPCPELQQVMLWFPNAQNPSWHNCYSEKGKTIVECPSNSNRLDRHVEETVEANMMRITYLKDKYRGDGYCYVGFFKLDKETTCKRHLCVWNRLEEDSPEYILLMSHLEKYLKKLNG